MSSIVPTNDLPPDGGDVQLSPSRQIWRIRGVPTHFDKEKLVNILHRHPDLQLTTDDTSGRIDEGMASSNGASAHTLAPDLQRNQVATVRFTHLPPLLRALKPSGQLTIDIRIPLEDTSTGTDTTSLPPMKLAIDQNFNGITTLFSPSSSEHQLDVLAISGLGSHPFGSFVHKRDGHMWLSDSLPKDMPTARVMIHGYQSGLQDSTSFAQLDDLASSLYVNICRLLRQEKQKHLILIGHSLGGLLIKEALTQMAESDFEADLLKRIHGLLFFGVPNDGMNISSLIPMVNNQPNQSLVLSLDPMNSQILRLQKRSFAKVMSGKTIKMYCFYETKISPTATKDPHTGRYKMNGPPRCLVTTTSATSCLPYGVSSDHTVAIDRTHSELVKFMYNDEEYEKVSYILSRVYQNCIQASSTPRIYSVPIERVNTYTQRTRLSKELGEALQVRHQNASIPFAVSVQGLGGTGKSQLALDYTEKHKDRYNPILWIDATDEESVLSSFKRCASKLGLPEKPSEKHGSVTEDAVVQAVLLWLDSRTDTDDEWLVVIDNVDDVSWGIIKIMPKGERGRVIITSQDDQSTRLIPKGCENVRVGIMSPMEGVALLLYHLKLDEESASSSIRKHCAEVVERLGYLALAIDIAGAYIGNNSSAAEEALSQYLEDYSRHQNEMLQMNDFRGLLPTEKTVWTVWDTTLEKITKNHADLHPQLVLIFLAHFKGSVIEDEMFRLASLGMEEVDAKLDEKSDEEAEEGIPTELRRLIETKAGKWDSFWYRKARDVLCRYSLLQRVQGERPGEWPGVTMHGLVQWRAKESYKSRSWQWWYVIFILAACCQSIKEDYHPDFRRNLVVHLQDIDQHYTACAGRKQGDFIGVKLCTVYYNEGRWEEAEKFRTEITKQRKARLGNDHASTLASMNNLGSIYRNQGRWKEAEKLQIEVIEKMKVRPGNDHPDTVISIANLGLVYIYQGRLEEAEKLQIEVVEKIKVGLGNNHPYTLTSMANLVLIYINQGRWEEAEKLQIEVVEERRIKLGTDHPDTLTSITNLGSIYYNQGLWEQAEKLQIEVVEKRRVQLGNDHPDTLTSIANLGLIYYSQGRLEEGEKLQIGVVEKRKVRLGNNHPDTLKTIDNLRLIYQEQGRWEEAEKLDKYLETLR